MVHLIPVYYHTLYIHLTISKICDWSYTGRIHVAGPYKYCLETTCDLGSRSQVFGHVLNSPPLLFSCFLLARSLPINKNQCATVLHLIFAFLSSLIVKAPKTFKDMYTSAATIYCRTWFMKRVKYLSGTYFVNIAVLNHYDLSRALVRSTCDLPRDWSYTCRKMVLNPRVTEA